MNDMDDSNKDTLTQIRGPNFRACAYSHIRRPSAPGHLQPTLKIAEAIYAIWNSLHFLATGSPARGGGLGDNAPV